MVVNTSIPGSWERYDPPVPNLPKAARDAFNWKKIAAEQKAEQDRKNAAKNRVKKKVQAAPKIKALAQSVAPAAPAPILSIKETIDAFRAANGGALPAGVTPEMAAMIDQGIWNDWSQLTANPALAQSLLAVQHQILSTPADYAAAKAKVSGQYDQLTGDVLASGKTWMQDLYGRIVDPNDPNAAAAAADPALAGYAQNMSQIQETGDLNEATDLAWFDKMQQNALSTNQGLLAAIAQQAAVAPSGGGGGGGGGRGRRGGRGGGGGGSSWKTPTNTLTNLTSATDTATGTAVEQNPGFYDALMEAAQGDPDLAALTQRLWEESSQDPRGLTQDVSQALTAAETEQENQILQGGLHQAWLANSPGTVQSSINKLLANKGAIRGDDPTTTNVTEKYYVPKVRGQNTPPIIQYSPQQLEENAVGEELLQHPSAIPTSILTQRIFGKGLRPHTPVGVLSPEALLEQKSKGGVSPSQLKILAQHGLKALREAQRGDTPETPFNWQSWSEEGGYVPEADKGVTGKTAKNIGFYNTILDAILPWNQNANFVQSRNQLINQGKDSSTFQTKTTDKSYTNALPGSPYDISYDIPEAAIESDPVSNPQEFNITTDKKGKQTATPIGNVFGESRNIPVSANLRDVLAKHAASIMTPAEPAPTPNRFSIFHGGSLNKQQPIRPRTRTATPKPVATPVETPIQVDLSSVFGTRPRPRMAAPKATGPTIIRKSVVNTLNSLLGGTRKSVAATKRPVKKSTAR